MLLNAFFGPPTAPGTHRNVLQDPHPPKLRCVILERPSRVRKYLIKINIRFRFLLSLKIINSLKLQTW